MELKEIQSLIKFVSESGVDEVQLEQKDFKLSIRKMPPAQQIIQATIPAAPAPVVSAPAPVLQAPAAAEAPAIPAAPAADVHATGNLVTIKSPMIGTFYRSPSPDKPVFVNVGDEIKQGQVLCIVEAMKLFNEIESDISGKIVKILAENAQPVEYDQPLFLVEPR